MITNHGLLGAYPLTKPKIESNVVLERPGAYALGFLTSQGVVQVERIGRSDTNLPRRLKEYVGQYKVFMYCYSQSPIDAFRKECWLYHEFLPQDNLIHPDRPVGMNIPCLRCSIFGAKPQTPTGLLRQRSGLGFGNNLF